MQLQGAVLFVKDLARMAGFYEQMLGLKSIDDTRTESWIQFEAGQSILSLHAIPAEIASGIEIASPPKARESSPTKLVFVVEDVESESRRLKALGVPILLRPWGNCDALDPEGNVFQIVSRTTHS